MVGEIRRGGKDRLGGSVREGSGAKLALPTCRPTTGRQRSATFRSREQQQVSIAKALAGDSTILILDEPSAILTDAEIEVLFRVVRRLTAAGVW